MALVDHSSAANHHAYDLPCDNPSPWVPHDPINGIPCHQTNILPGEPHPPIKLPGEPKVPIHLPGDDGGGVIYNHAPVSHSVAKAIMPNISGGGNENGFGTHIEQPLPPVKVGGTTVTPTVWTNCGGPWNDPVVSGGGINFTIPLNW